ncbi:Purine trans deoxyribosylase (Nucleoside deoxyribosyltransferase-I) [Enterococcus phage VPE25]|nr:Purine trans deoxyribosylase (Nucleoside deoxyribosyltransferase-I) [Enterococcus phage VPE25]
MEFLKEGQKVVVKYNENETKIGQIIEVDDLDSEMPYRVQYKDGSKIWVYATDVEPYNPRRKVYLAGPFFSDKQIEIVNELHGALNENKSIESVFVPMEHQMNDGDLEEFTAPWAQAVAMNDYKNVREADIVVAIVDFDGQDMDSGTAAEIGYAYAIGKPVFLFHKENHEIMVNLMVTEVAQAYFTDLQQVKDYNFTTQEKIPFSGKYR